MESRTPDMDTNAERRRRERPVWGLALAVSLGLHLLVLLLFPVQSLLIDPAAAAGPRSGDDQAAPGSMQAMNMRVPPSTPIIPPPIPLPVLTDVEPVEFEPEENLEAPAISGEAIGALEAPGLEDGTGEGDGGTSEEGLYRLQAPSPRAMFWPPDPPEMENGSVEVWVFVDAAGRVVADSTQLRPPTRDRDWNRRVIELSAEWVFTPAMKDGKPVASWFPYSVGR
ncbi:MAG TPA: hypothetical protein VK858_16635 [Longimicrobiales bacterium]|nr:hypothetical protein [Longimicrobiales bacterium]